ncbi:hypothetical protein LLG96_15030 [bacterium]|nr:hypothetical protein [bacterium]
MNQKFHPNHGSHAHLVVPLLDFFLKIREGKSHLAQNLATRVGVEAKGSFLSSAPLEQTYSKKFKNGCALNVYLIERMTTIKRLSQTQELERSYITVKSL